MALTNKQAIILNYGQLLNDIGNDLKEHSDFIHHFFDREPDLNHDSDLVEIGMEFQEFCIALKMLDKMVGAKHHKVFKD